MNVLVTWKERLIKFLFLVLPCLSPSTDREAVRMGRKQPRNPLWIQGAHLKKGAFTNLCKTHGSRGGVTKACIDKGEHSRSVHIEREARLANTFRHMNHQ